MRRITMFFTGLCVVGLMTVAALVWPVATSYLSWPPQPRDQAVIERQFDRTALRADLVAAGLAIGDEAYVRIFKREHLLEVWMRPAASERFALFRSYPICTWSGGLGPKLSEGDRQAPEGFYRVAARQLNPNSRHHLAFNLGFPNALDRELGRTGSYIMVHGGCSSVGCFAMTDQQIDEIYAVVEGALNAGQREVDVAVFPFRMTETALQVEAASGWVPFWRNLKRGFDLFERDRTPPEVAACNGAYVFGNEALGPGCTPITGWA